MVINNTPYWEFFVYVDKTSIASVLDTPTTREQRRSSDGDYWFTIVASALSGTKSRIWGADGLWIEDYEGGQG